MPPDDNPPVRMIVSVPFGGTHASRAAERFRAAGLEVDEVMDIVGSLVVVGTEAKVRAVAESVPDLLGIEPEQILKTQ